ncbi:hypothetical protein GYA19_03235, partial [Candidatus Beckwithbacteria bacterium]|nr:hypothetical protein [Candidatus Beckwithbacteria bacterium]
MYTLNQIPSEAKIRKFLRKTIFGRHVYCPRCKSQRIISSHHR